MGKARNRIRIGRAPQTDSIFTKEQRAGKVLQVAEILKRATLSRFQHEAACRYGLRQALCLQGHPWAASDAEAARIVASALDAIGAVRPTWAVGQRETVTPLENCSWCADPIDDDDVAKGRRFCDEVCARAAIANRDYEFGYANDVIGRNAFLVILRARMQPMACEGCQREFTPAKPATRFCSTECGNRARRYLADCTCPNCGIVFRPGGSGQRYCSPDCAVAHKPVVLGIRHCAECGREFYPKHETAIYCSERCNGRAKEARKKAARHAALTPRCCPNCSKTFTPRRRDAVFCSERCQKQAARKRALSPS